MAQTCPACGKSVNPNRRFCGNCGQRLRRTPGEQPLICTDCGAEVENEGNRYCTNCGSKFED